MTAEVVHRARTPLHLRWAYGADLSDVTITAVVSSKAGEVGRLKVLRAVERGPGEIDLIASADTVAAWPTGQLALDVLLLRGDVSGRLDTILIDLREAA